MSAVEIILSAVEIILKLAAVCLLASYLVFKHRQRWRHRSPTEDPAKWTGQPIDAARLRPAVERVRNDYMAARFQRPQSLPYRRSLLVLAGRAIRRFPFFRDRYGEEDAHENAT
jgi:hypothetical protein